MTPAAQAIRDEIRARGPIPFARFMELALYHPEGGYYAAGRVRIGADEGDFTTAPHLSRLFGRCLARWVEAADRALGRPDPFVLVEGGPGEGRLARDLLDALAERNPDLYRRLRYAADEASPALDRRRRDLLAPHAERCLAAAPEGFEGVYLSNELVDALPVHRLRGAGPGLREAFVDRDGEGFVEVWAEPSEAARRFLDGYAPPLGDWEVEIRPAAGAWLGRVAGLLGRGYVLTIDYGDRADRLYGPHRPRGTAVAYRAHRLVEGLLADPGEQDLTAHVDFTHLVEAGRALGLEPLDLRNQREFLFAWGLEDEVRDLEARLPEVERLAAMQALAPLLLPGPGMGDTFRALVQGKGVGKLEG
ncbi:class I SAM-dependent methyltransferase [Deferrisoma sp.]